jgi:hypothetical protein
MKHIHFIIYRLKSIIIVYCFFILLLFIHSFFIICIYSEMEFIKPSDDVEIQRKTITFTKYQYRTVFINKMINSGIMRMFIFIYIIAIFIYSFLLEKCYAFLQMIVVFLVWEILNFSLMILFFFCLIIWWGIGIASESKLEVLKDGWFHLHNCFYYSLFFCLIILFYYYSNIPYMGD